MLLHALHSLNKSALPDDVGRGMKQEGNDLFRVSRFEESVSKYLDAIKRSPSCDASLYSNISNAYFKLGRYELSLLFALSATALVKLKEGAGSPNPNPLLAKSAHRSGAAILSLFDQALTINYVTNSRHSAWAQAAVAALEHLQGKQFTEVRDKLQTIKEHWNKVQAASASGAKIAQATEGAQSRPVEQLQRPELASILPSLSAISDAVGVEVKVTQGPAAFGLGFSQSDEWGDSADRIFCSPSHQDPGAQLGLGFSVCCVYQPAKEATRRSFSRAGKRDPNDALALFVSVKCFNSPPCAQMYYEAVRSVSSERVHQPSVTIDSLPGAGAERLSLFADTLDLDALNYTMQKQTAIVVSDRFFIKVSVAYELGTALAVGKGKTLRLTAAAVQSANSFASNPSFAPLLGQVCAVCFAKPTKVLLCGQCGWWCVCGKECQRQGWSMHKRSCPSGPSPVAYPGKEEGPCWRRGQQLGHSLDAMTNSLGGLEGLGKMIASLPEILRRAERGGL